MKAGAPAELEFGALETAMDMRVSQQLTGQGQFTRELLGSLGPEVATRVLSAAGDIALILDSDGVVRDLAVAGQDLAREGVTDWLDKPWVDLVTPDSKPKVQQLLKEAGPAGRWREINHSGGSGSIPLRFLTVDSGQQGRLIAIGRDLRAAAALQQRLMHAQQEMERDYLRLRHTESRYRLLFQIASEAVVVVEAASRKIVEANPAAGRLLGADETALVGQPFARLIHPDSREQVSSLLAGVQAAGRTQSAGALLANRPDAPCAISASLFRQERQAHFLVKLAPVDKSPTLPDAERRLLDVLQRLPDAFVVTDESLSILAVNTAFLDLAQLAAPEQAKGQPLETFLGRPGIDLTVLIANLREHGSVRNFATVFRNQYEAQEDVEVSGVSVPDGEPPCFGFTVRAVGRRLGDQPRIGRELPRSVEQLTDLVGRVSLKEIVRETADLIERLCIEAALELTGNNRASAAEILGLSRQSLYSKLHRYGLGNLGSDFDGA